MSETMLPFSEVNWAELIPSTESPIKLCLRKDIPGYIKVRTDSQLVYRFHLVSMGLRKETIFRRIANFSLRGPAWETDYLPMKGFHKDLLFLRLDNYSLAEIAVAGSASVSRFSRDGFSMPRPSRQVGETRGGFGIEAYESIKDPTLEKVKFGHAFLVDKRKWEWASPRTLGGDAFLLENCIVSTDVGERDLYFTTTDIRALKEGAQQERELVHYPFAHKERMPGIYWMFQAARAHNDRKVISKGGVKSWLKEVAPKNTYRYRSDRTAEKFVWPEVDRAKGSVGRGEFNLDELDGWADKSEYEFPFVSKGLSFILAIADWWIDVLDREPDAPALTLAKKLKENKFRGDEVDHLVFLISGARIQGPRLR